MDNLYLALATTENYKDMMSMEAVIEYIDFVTSILAAIGLALLIYGLVIRMIASKTGTGVNLYFEFIINLLVAMIWGFIFILNEAVAWSSPSGEIGAYLKTTSLILAGLCAIKALFEWLRIKKISKMAGEISIVLVNPDEGGGLRDCDTQPFVYPYREGTGEGKTDTSDETEAVVAGNNA